MRVSQLSTKDVISFVLVVLICLWTSFASAQLVLDYAHTSRITALIFSPNSKYLVSGSCDPLSYDFESNYLIIANMDRRTTEFINTRKYRCSPLSILTDDNLLVFEGEDKILNFCDIVRGSFKKTISSLFGSFLAISPDAKYLLSKGENNTINIIDATDLELIQTLTARAAIGFSEDGHKVAVENFERSIEIWSVKENLLLKNLDQVRYPYYQLPSLSNDFKYLAAPRNQTIQIWDISTGEIIRSIPHTLKDRFEPITVISNDGNFLAAGSKQKIYVWETFSGKLLMELNVERGFQVSKLLFAPNSNLLAVASVNDPETSVSGVKSNSNSKGMIQIWSLKGSITSKVPDLENHTPVKESSQLIKMTKEDGVFKVPCSINGLSLSFILDTGASNVSISLTEALFMLKNGYLDESDILGVEKYRIANGQIAEGTKIILRSVRIGETEIHNVEATVLHNVNSPLLFGLSALQRFGKIELDYDSQTLKLGQ